MSVPHWLFIVLLFGVPLVGGMYRHAQYQKDSLFPDPHPVLGWLGAIAIFAGAYAVVTVAGYGALLGLGALLDWLS